MRGSRVTAQRAVICLAAAAAALTQASAMPASASGGTLPLVVGNKHVLWSAGAGAPTPSTTNLIYHGGLVETKPAVYIVYWGPQWRSGFSFAHGGFTYTNKTVTKYVDSFFSRVGGSAWAGVQTQYCDNIDLGVPCAGQLTAQYITNPAHQLKGTWFDTSTPPATIATTGLAENTTNDPLATEALAAAQHFGYNINATYFILTQPGIVATGYGTVYCAYHAETAHTTGHGVRYSFVPYVPEQGAGCGIDTVNADDAFGNGYLDGYSIVAGHEYAEAVTDPDNLNGVQDGWNDVQTSENGDKCAWTGLQNISLGGTNYAVQPLWSNEANGGQGACAVTR